MAQDISIIIDTREKHPWDFPIENKIKSGYKTKVIGSEVVGLDAADYSIVGYTDLIRIERKMGAQEIMGNVINRENRERFERELEKLRGVKFKYILIETNLSNDLLAMTLPQFGKFAPPFSKVFKYLHQYKIDYGVDFIFVGDAGQKICRYLFELALLNE